MFRDGPDGFSHSTIFSATEQCQREIERMARQLGFKPIDGGAVVLETENGYRERIYSTATGVVDWERTQE